MKLGSLFDGSGGFPLAGSLCGIEPVWASEVEPYPIAVTKSRFQNMKHLGSVTEVHGGDIEPVDIITFGSPCQDLSVAGKRAGLKHEANGDEETTRSGLFMEAVRIIKEMRKATNGEYPTFAVWENVPGAFSSNKGEDFRTVLEELIKIVEPTAVMPAVPKNGWPYADSYCGDGWSLAYRVFDAQYWGVPQRRRRIYLVLDLRGQRAGKVSFEREGVRGYFAESGTPWKAVAGDAADCAGTADKAKCYGIDGYNSAMDEVAATLGVNCGMSTGRNGALILNSHSGNRMAGADAAIRTGTDGCEGECVAYAIDQQGGKGALVQENKSATLATNNDQYLFQPVNMVLDDQGGQQITVRTDGKAPTLRAETHGNLPVVAFTMQAFGNNKDCGIGSGLKARDYKDATDLVVESAGIDCHNFTEYPELYPTLQAKPNGGQSLNFSGAVRAQYIVRRLTTTECARLQGFPDRWGDIDQKEDFTEEEYRFWCDVVLTKSLVDGTVAYNEDGELYFVKQLKPYKQKTKEQMLNWYNKLHTDSSEYKMWGNGISLPTALYVMQGIAEALKGGEGRRWQG